VKNQKYNNFPTPPTKINKATDNDLLLQTIRRDRHSASGKTDEPPTKPKRTRVKKLAPDLESKVIGPPDSQH